MFSKYYLLHMLFIKCFLYKVTSRYSVIHLNINQKGCVSCNVMSSAERGWCKVVPGNLIPKGIWCMQCNLRISVE